MRTTGFGNSGAYVSMMGTMQPTITTMKNTIGVYKTPLIEQSTKLVFTNTTPVAPYRGAGRPEGNYYMERLIDQAAREMGIDRIEIRKRNHIKPKEMPYKTPSENTLRQRRLSRRCSSARWNSPTSRALPSASARARNAASCAASASAASSNMTAPASQGTRRHPLRDGRHGDDHHRHARFRSGPRHAVRAGAVSEARHPVRQASA